MLVSDYHPPQRDTHKELFHMTNAVANKRDVNRRHQMNDNERRKLEALGRKRCHSGISPTINSILIECGRDRIRVTDSNAEQTLTPSRRYVTGCGQKWDRNTQERQMFFISQNVAVYPKTFFQQSYWQLLTNGMQQLHPVMYLLFKVQSQFTVDDLWNFCTVLIKI